MYEGLYRTSETQWTGVEDRSDPWNVSEVLGSDVGLVGGTSQVDERDLDGMSESDHGLKGSRRKDNCRKLLGKGSGVRGSLNS